ncbi:MAG: hypothetical protein KDC38_13620 [Planctomycetes bacterium]|nr:hypothetical protein [Planctomycetota bacterium]
MYHRRTDNSRCFAALVVTIELRVVLWIAFVAYLWRTRAAWAALQSPQTIVVGSTVMFIELPSVLSVLVALQSLLLGLGNRWHRLIVVTIDLVSLAAYLVFLFGR